MTVAKEATPTTGKKKVVNVISLSGGKDSTALALLAVERGVENPRFVFADTGHEHPATVEYVAYLDDVLKRRCGVGIQTVRASFDERIAAKREFIKEKWFDDLVKGKPGRWQAKDGHREIAATLCVPPAPRDVYANHETEHFRWIAPTDPLTPEEAADKIKRALDVLKPTGNPFLDLCLWKGRFPSTRRRFCSEQLKHVPIEEQVFMPLMKEHAALISWQGVRRDESHARAKLAERDVEFGQWEPEPKGILIYRPILDWTVEDVFAMHRKHGIRWNPLYEQGMGRVGCMPCIHAGKREMREITKRFPEEIERVAAWEKLVSHAAKRDCSTLMDARQTAKFLGTDTRSKTIRPDSHGIKTYAQWAKTARGGKQMDLIAQAEESPAALPMCSSIYGLCE